MHQIDSFFNVYKTLKAKWINQVNESSQGIIKNVVNKIIFNQHLESFEESEFGELSDYTGLQERMIEVNKAEIVGMLEELQGNVSVFEEILGELKIEIEKVIELKPHLVSCRDTQLKSYLDPLYKAYEEEFQMRKNIAADICSGFHMNSPYDVLVTITAAWSGRPYTNERAIAELEKFLDFESGTARISRLNR